MALFVVSRKYMVVIEAESEERALDQATWCGHWFAPDRLVQRVDTIQMVPPELLDMPTCGGDPEMTVRNILQYKAALGFLRDAGEIKPP